MEKPRTDDASVSAEGREQPVIEPETTTAPAGVVEQSDVTTGKAQTDDPTKLDQSGDAGKEPPAKGKGSGGKGSAKGKS